MLIDRLLLSHRNDSNSAVICGGVEYSYRTLYQEVIRHVSLLKTVVAGPAIGLWLPNGIWFPIAYLSSAMLEKTIVPIGANLTEHEVSKVAAHCELRLLITDTEHYARLKASTGVFSQKLAIYLIDSKTVVYLNSALDFCPTPSEEILSDVFILLNTSGTSDNPKVVMLTEQNLEANIQSITECMEIRSDDRTLIVLPLSLSSGHIQMLTHFYMGACVEISEGPFFPPRFFALLKQRKITNFCCVTFLLKSFIESGARHALPHLRHVGVGGGFVPSALLESAVATFPGVTFYHYYGQTEASPRLTQMAQMGECRLTDSIGKAIPGVSVRINRLDGTSCLPREEGEVVAAGENIMKGYFKNPDATAATLCNGWLHTGDIGMMDEDGHLYLKGRKKNVIISNGINIYPEDIEEVLLRHPKVKEAYVYAEENKFYQQVPAAKIIGTADLTADELTLHCKQFLAAIKVPTQFEFCKQLPKTESGKLKRT